VKSYPKTEPLSESYHLSLEELRCPIFVSNHFCPQCGQFWAIKTALFCESEKWIGADFAEAKESKTRKSAKAPARRGRPPLAPELYVEFSGKQYNVTDIIDRAKADYRATHKVGVQSCKVYVKPEEDAAYYVINKVSGKLEL